MIGVLLLVFPSFLSSNNNLKIFSGISEGFSPKLFKISLSCVCVWRGPSALEYRVGSNDGHTDEKFLVQVC